MTGQNDFRTFNLATAAQTTVAGQAIPLTLKPQARLKTAFLGVSGTSSGPLWASLTLFRGPIANPTGVAVLATGWVRNDANAQQTDSLYWTGDVPLGTQGQPLLVPRCRNDSGSTVVVVVAWEWEE